MSIIDWQSHFTPHQASTWRAWERLCPGTVTHIVARPSNSRRTQQGWASVDVRGMQIVDLKERGWLAQGLGILRAHGDGIHVFGGFWGDRRFLVLIVCALLRGIRVVVMNEAYATAPVGYLSDSPAWVNGIKVMLRPFLYRVLALAMRPVARANRLCLLALSKRAEGQFLHAGFSPEQVFAFGYFVPRLARSPSPRTASSGPTRLVFVGSLLETKGVDLAVRAVEALAARSVPLHLDLYGHGDAGRYLPPSSRFVAYRGAIPFGQAQRVIADYDALLLPSRHDGWGVVVNEALLQGVPVIASSHVGAACLIEASGAGMVFESGDMAALQGALARFVVDRPARQAMRRRAGIVGALITPERAAAYMHDVFAHFFFARPGRPCEVWCDRRSPGPKASGSP